MFQHLIWNTQCDQSDVIQFLYIHENLIYLEKLTITPSNNSKVLHDFPHYWVWKYNWLVKVVVLYTGCILKSSGRIKDGIIQ